MTVGRGRPRDSDADERILVVARQKLLEKGYGGFNIDDVASAAGVAKTTLYRRWPTKDHLAVAVIAEIQDAVAIGGTDDVVADLTNYFTAIATGLNAMRSAGRTDPEDMSAGTVAELTASVSRHADLLEASRVQFAKRNNQAIAMIDRAKAEGFIRPEIDGDVLFDQLAGALYYRVLLSVQPINEAYVRRLLANTLITP